MYGGYPGSIRRTSSPTSTMLEMAVAKDSMALKGDADILVRVYRKARLFRKLPRNDLFQG